jgi:hypothetical protein
VALIGSDGAAAQTRAGRQLSPCNALDWLIAAAARVAHETRVPMSLALLLDTLRRFTDDGAGIRRWERDRGAGAET